METISFAPSRNIKDIRYDADAQTIYILFHSGRAYKYPGLSGDIANGFSQSLSANDYLRSFVTNQSDGEIISSEERSSIGW